MSLFVGQSGFSGYVLFLVFCLGYPRCVVVVSLVWYDVGGALLFCLLYGDGVLS